jgi:hypothetical protein
LLLAMRIREHSSFRPRAHQHEFTISGCRSFRGVSRKRAARPLIDENPRLGRRRSQLARSVDSGPLLVGGSAYPDSVVHIPRQRFSVGRRAVASGVAADTVAHLTGRVAHSHLEQRRCAAADSWPEGAFHQQRWESVVADSPLHWAEVARDCRLAPSRRVAAELIAPFAGRQTIQVPLVC